MSTVFKGGIDSNVELGMSIVTKKQTDLKLDPFLLLKQELLEALSDAGYQMSLDISKDVPTYASSGRTASIVVEGKVIGTLFEVSPEVKQKFDLPARAAALTLDVTALKEIPAATIVATVVPEFPAITYDTTIEMTHDKSAGNLLKQISESSKLLESVDIADIYGKESGAYKLTLRCTYRSPDKTLTDEEVKKEYANVEKLLQ